MLIKLQDIKDGEVLHVEHTYDPKKLELEFVDLHYLKPLRMEGEAEKGANVLTFRGTLDSETEVMCGRCLKSMKAPLHKDFELFFETEGKDAVDTTDDLREILILDHALAYVCNENCRGLCPACGTNLNESQCKCENQDRSGSLAQIKDIWKKKKEESK